VRNAECRFHSTGLCEAPVTPKYAKVKTWCALSGMGRSSTYVAIAEGFLRAVKFRDSTLIDVEHGLAQIAALPSARTTIGRRSGPRRSTGVPRPDPVPCAD
jgi:hypothetical protein